MRKLSALLLILILGLTLGGCGVDWFPAANTTSSGDAAVTAFTIAAKNGVAPGATAVSDTITVAMTSTTTATTAAISVSGATGSEYSTDNGATWTSTAGTVSNGASVKVRHIASTTLGQSVTTKLTIGSVSADFVSTVYTATVSSFAFTNISGVQPSTTQTSNPVTVQLTSGTAANVSVSGDSSSEYAVNSLTSYSKVAGSMKNNETILVRNTASATLGATVTTNVTVGDKTVAFTTKTANVKKFAVSATGLANADVFTPATVTLKPGTYMVYVKDGSGYFSFDGTTSFFPGEDPVPWTFTSAETEILLDDIAPSTGSSVTTIVIDGVESTYTVTPQ
ncbi:hypothetical protein LPW11_02335 [Geomonas sp. RF6]|uniref:hypothetical protein n=1 Tax=Geomonas sp. RF6 TaxID=2897342 RepID=UPI001E31FF3A|nr:hypothetical protein [Geomonas sp. RF6]UFS71036.1 hypothetical protein LPW11_02335 [Geomonas sp. RF6]